MAQFVLPALFIILWSSAFVAGKAGVQYATPFAFLAARFIIVALVFGGVAIAVHLWRHRDKPTSAQIVKQKPKGKDTLVLTAIVGLLLHGFYLGSTFLAMSLGLGAALAALVASMQPLLTTALAMMLFGEKPLIFCGFVAFIINCFTNEELNEVSTTAAR